VRENGTVSAWGRNDKGQTSVPSSATNVVGVAAGTLHSLALRGDGSVVGWGATNYEQTTIPAAASNVVSVAAGGDMSFALLTNGTVLQWGNTNATVPADLTNASAIAAGFGHGLALRKDGTVSAWGSGPRTNVPSGLSNVVSIAAGAFHSLALKVDGTVVSWGGNMFGQTDVPSGLSNVMAIAAGWFHSVALKNDGTLLLWGNDRNGQTSAPAGVSNVPVKLIAAGGNQTVAQVFSGFTHYQIDVTKDLLLIYNTNSPGAASSNVCAYYLAHRPLVSKANVLGIGCTNEEDVELSYVTNQIVSRISQWLSNNPTKHPQYVILFPDIPTRTYRIVSGTNRSDMSVAVAIRLASFEGIHPFVTSINMGYDNPTNDCIHYIDKVASFANGSLIIRGGAAAGGTYGNTNYYFDDVYGGNTYPLYGDQTKTAVLAVNPGASVIYTNGNDYGTNLNLHIRNGTHVAAYFCFGAHSALENLYSRNGYVVWGANSAWWIIQTMESFNGQRNGGHGNVYQWFSNVGFGGTNYMNYENTPVGAVSNTEEDGAPGSTEPTVYFRLWEQGRNFAICAWNSLTVGALQVVGDPFVAK